MKKQIEEIMSKRIITTELNDSVRTAYQIMQEHQIRHLPVVDRTGSVIGILSDRDLQRAMIPQADPNSAESPDIEFDPNFQARHFMSWPVKTIQDSTTICDAAKEMVKDKISAFVVVTSSGRTRGIITSHDFLKFLIQLLEKDSSRLHLSLETIFDGLTQGNYLV